MAGTDLHADRQADRWLRPLWLLFFASGAAALIYEVIWFQILQLIIGSSAISLGVLLGTFMGGMCLGSYVLPRVAARARNPLRVYAALELGIGAAALALIWGAPSINDLYAAVGGGSVVVRALVAALCLLPPTMLMGATLPAIARWVEATPQGVSWLGYFYSGNIAGAVAGCLIASLYLLRFYDVAVGTYVAVCLNAGVAASAWLIAARSGRDDGARAFPLGSADPREPDVAARGGTADSRKGRSTRTKPKSASTVMRVQDVGATFAPARIYGAIALSGLTALSAQVVWTRLLSLLFGGTVYTFSLILAVFLLGLGLGSTVGAALSRRVANARVALGVAQLIGAAAMVWAGYRLMAVLPFDPVSEAVMTDPLRKYSLDLWRSVQVVLPAAIIWGASFPLALSALARPGEDPGRLVGGVYAANTLGAIAGSIGVGLFLVARIGSQHTQQVLVLIALAAAGLALIPAGAPTRAFGARRARAITGMVALALAAVLGAAWLPAVPGVLIAFGRFAPVWADRVDIPYAGEGLNAFVAVSKTRTGVLSYHNSGKVQAGSEGADMRLQRMLGHFSHLLPRTPKEVLVVGLGAGVTAGAVSIAPSVERVTIVEIEPLVPKAVAAYFGDYNSHVVDDPKVNVVVDDGRHYLLTTDRTFDVITSDPLDPWIKGAATLFTEEFFQTMRRHLNPGGVVTQFVQLYGSNRDAVKSEIGTFIKVFPHTLVFGNLTEGRGYDLVLVGQVEPMMIDVDRVQARLDDPSFARVASSLRDIGVTSAVDLFASLGATSDDLQPWLTDATINTDRNLRLQYLAGLTLNANQSAGIYSEILRYRRFPESILAGSPAILQQLRQRLTSGSGHGS